jgi:Spy/CpxP family protein refolding chaperone
MKKFSGINKVLVTLVILLATTFSFAQNAGAKTDDAEALFGNFERSEGNFHHRRGDRIRGFIAEQLGLSDAQKAQIKQIRENHKDNVKPLIQELRAKKQELRQSFEGDVYNETLAAQKISEMSGVKARLIGERFKMKKEILAVLTPEQKTKLDQIKEQFKARHGERMRNRGL